MKQTYTDFGSELRLPTQWLVYFPLFLGIIALVLSASVLDPDLRLYYQLAGFGLASLAPITSILCRWHAWLGKSFFLLILSGLIMGVSMWQQAPVLLVLLMIPAGLTAVFITPKASTLTAALETIAVLVLARTFTSPPAWITLGTILSAIWATVILLVIAYHPIKETAQWAWDFYQQALDLREAAFTRKQALEQTLTDLANANRQLAKTSKRMADLRTIAEEAQKAKAMFLAKVSHEFRTPLNMIIGLVELMVKSPQLYAIQIPPEMENDLLVILRNSRHLASIVNDVLDLTRLETGRVSLHKEWVDLSTIIDEAVEAVRPLVEKKGVTLEVQIPPDLPEVYCDRTRIRQVVLNLVSNAARFTEQGSITVELYARNQHVVTDVTDTGPGISKENLEQIFEPFSQGDGDIWRDKGGSGLGLSISQQFVNLHRGRLWVESEVGVGSSFKFKLPITQPLESTLKPGYQINEAWVWHESAFRTERAGVSRQVRKPLIGVVEENDSLYPELMRYHEEVDLIQAREPGVLQDSEKPYPADTILINTPALEDIKVSNGSHHFIVQCSVIAPTARATAAGAQGYLIKPVSREDLMGVLERMESPTRRVLIVDDDADVQQLFSRMLHVCDPSLEITTASSGSEALDKLRDRAFDLMLLDILMPDMNGWQCLEHLSQERPPIDVPVYLITAQDPADGPASSPYLLAKAPEGFSVKKLLRCSLEIRRLLMTPETELDPTPPPTRDKQAV
jgi:signal transduction histidine kinase/CheY-like chemotaxis protein